MNHKIIVQMLFPSRMVQSYAELTKTAKTNDN